MPQTYIPRTLEKTLKGAAREFPAVVLVALLICSCKNSQRASRLLLEGPGGMFKGDQKVDFTMAHIEAERTRVFCRAVIDKMGFLPGLLLKGQARSFARSTFEAIDERLKELA